MSIQTTSLPVCEINTQLYENSSFGLPTEAIF